MRLLLGLGWGMVVAIPLVARIGLSGARERARSLTRAEKAGKGGHLGKVVGRPGVGRPGVVGRLGVVGRVIAGIGEQRRDRRRDVSVRRDLAPAIDILAVAIGAGLTPYLGVGATAPWVPSAISHRFTTVTARVNAGSRFSEALDHVAYATPALRPLADALLASERLGAPVGPALERLAVEARADARREAETRARRVPVRLLFPLVFGVLPSFGLLTVVPALVAGMRR